MVTMLEEPQSPASLPAAGEPSSRRLELLAAVVLVGLAVGFVHSPALSAKALFFDDYDYLARNPLVLHPSWDSAWRFISEVGAPSTVRGYYQPLTMISLMLDCAMGGGPDHLAPLHRTSLILHAINSALVVVLLYQLFGHVGVAAALGLLFGLHPMTVETIPWVGERKTLLATFFAFASTCMYLRHCSARHLGWLTGSIVAYGLALLSKPTIVPLPIMLLLMDAWPLRRFSRLAVLEKVPYFVLMVAGAVVTYYSQREGVRAIQYSTEPLAAPTPPALKLLYLVCHNVIFYPWKMLWPAGMTPFHAHPLPFTWSQPAVLSGLVGTPLLLALLALSLRWTRSLAVGWLIFFVGLFPTLGLVSFTNVIASDKFAYFPAIGLLMVLACAGVRMIQAACQRGSGTALSVVLTVLVILFATAEARASRRYHAVWQGSEGLYRHALAHAAVAPLLHNGLGQCLGEQGRHEEAVAEFLECLRITPDFPDARYNLANSYLLMGRMEDARREYEAVLKIAPRLTEARLNYAVVLKQLGRPAESIAQVEEALKLKPTHAMGLRMLSTHLYEQGDLAAAIAVYERAVEQGPFEADVYYDWGKLMEAAGDENAAAQLYDEAIRRRPDHSKAHFAFAVLLNKHGRRDQALVHYYRAATGPEGRNDSRIHYNLANLVARKGRFDEAITHYRNALKLSPSLQEAHFNLGGVLLTQKRPTEAVAEFQEALRLKPDDPDSHFAMAEALSALSRDDEAASHYRRALELNPHYPSASERLSALHDKHGASTRPTSEPAGSR